MPTKDGVRIETILPNRRHDPQDDGLLLDLLQHGVEKCNVSDELLITHVSEVSDISIEDCPRIGEFLAHKITILLPCGEGIFRRTSDSSEDDLNLPQIGGLKALLVRFLCVAHDEESAYHTKGGTDECGNYCIGYEASPHAASFQSLCHLLLACPLGGS